MLTPINSQSTGSLIVVGNKMAESREGDAITALGTFLNKESCVGVTNAFPISIELFHRVT